MSQIASLDEGFVRTPTDAVYPYHSIYDSQRFEELYADPGFYRHVCRHIIIPELNDPNRAAGGCRATPGVISSTSHRLDYCTLEHLTLCI